MVTLCAHWAWRQAPPGVPAEAEGRTRSGPSKLFRGAAA